MKTAGIVLAVLAALLAGCADQGDAQAVLDAHPMDLAMLTQTHGHKMTDVQPGQTAPTIDIQAIPDPMKAGQFNVRISVTGFEFAPENVSTASRFGEGHTHVYVDEVLIGRAYGEYFHLATLKPGEHTILVSLNHNDHSSYAIDGRPIEDSVTVMVQAGMHG